MKYQHILNDRVLFESDSVDEFFTYLLTYPLVAQARNSILYNLLIKSNGYVCNMVTKKQERVPVRRVKLDNL